ncbi:MAG: hypothetical protein K2H20_02250, partial [Bacilli bacterium]|nr:hypothetical protein [Bacilli bacterium]
TGTKNHKKRPVIKTTGLALVIASMISTPAYAYVEQDDFIGEAEYCDTQYINRDETKLIEAQTIENLFNNCTERTITLDEIKKAITLSDVLNTYYPGPTELSNTDVDEIVSVDINGLYKDYTRALKRNNEAKFCQNHIGDLAAIDAFTLFSCRTVTNELKSSIATRISSIVTSEGYQVTVWPSVEINANEAYVIIGTNNGYFRYNLEGPVIDEVKSVIAYLESQYTSAINIAKGTSNTYENAFVVNGVNPKTNTTVYLTFGDSDRKDTIVNGISLINKVRTFEALEFTKSSSNTI